MKRIVLICMLLLLVGCNSNSKELNNSDIKKLNKYIEKFEETINYNNENIQMMKAQNYGSSVYGDWEYYKDKKKEYENEYLDYYVTYKMM